MYEREQPIGEKVLFDTHTAADLDANQLEETSELEVNPYDLDENQFDQYSDNSDSSDLETESEEQSVDNLSFL